MNGTIAFRKEGDWIIGTAEVTRAGHTPQRFEARANVREIVTMLAPLLARRHMQQLATAGALPGGVPTGPIYVGSFFGGLTKKLRKLANKVAHMKIMKDLAKVTKGILKMPLLNQAIKAAALAFPPLGVPALVAFQAANTTLDLAERSARGAKKFALTLNRLRTVARRRDAAGVKARKALRVLQVTHRWRKGLRAAQAQTARRAGVRGLPPSPISLPVRGW